MRSEGDGVRIWKGRGLGREEEEERAGLGQRRGTEIKEGRLVKGKEEVGGAMCYKVGGAMCYTVKMPRKERLSRTKVDEVAECFRDVTNVLETQL